MAVWTDKRLLRYDSIRKIGSNRWKNAASKYTDMKTFIIKEPNFLIDPKNDIYFDRVMSITRRRTLDMIKKLQKKEKSINVNKFLSGILNKKCFYTYYNRTGDEALFSIVQNNRQKLLSR